MTELHVYESYRGLFECCVLELKDSEIKHHILGILICESYTNRANTQRTHGKQTEKRSDNRRHQDALYVDGGIYD